MVGENTPHDSDEEDTGLDAEAAGDKNQVSCGSLLKSEFEQLAKRSYVVRRGRNNRLLVRPIMQMVFDEGPNSYELSHGLPGQNLLENQLSSQERIYGVGNNFYQRRYMRDILKKSRDNTMK